MEDNYVILINRFWTCSIERVFNSSDCMLYFYLLNTCNKLRWKQPFGQSDRYLSNVLGMSVPTIRAAKLRLKHSGLIDFRVPPKVSKSHDGQTKYCFPNVTTTVQNFYTYTYTDAFTDAFTDTCSDALTNSKLNQTKLNEGKKSSRKKQLQLPFASRCFVEAWQKLSDMPKWKIKPFDIKQIALSKLAEFDEDFAIELIENAIIGQWSGLVFPETQLKYEQRKEQMQNATKQAYAKRGKDLESDKRKAEIVRRANNAAEATRSRNQ